MDLDKLIDDFNEGDHDILKFFSDKYELFFKFLEKQGRLEDIDAQGPYSEDFQNYLLLYYYEKDKEQFYNLCNTFLSDIEIEGGKIYVITDADDLSALFCRNRDYSLETIEKIIDGTIDFGWYSYDIDVYDNVIDELDTENIIRLKEVILKELKDTEISPETEVLELIASEQGHIEFATINSENIHKIVTDKETMESLLDDELNDLKFELKNLYHRAESDALQEEYYEEVWSELSTYFYGKPEWVSIRSGNTYDKDGKATPRYIDKIKLEVSDFDKWVVDYLENNKKYGNQGTLEYQGYFMNILKEDADCLRVSWPDYADHRKTIKFMNEEFRDYI